MMGGILGTFPAGIFSATSLGVIRGYSFNSDAGIDSMGGQVYVQVIGILVTIVFTAVVTWVLLKITGLLDLRPA